MLDFKAPPEAHCNDEFRCKNLLRAGLFWKFGRESLQGDVVVFGFCCQVENRVEEGFWVVCHWGDPCEEAAEECWCCSLPGE